MGAVLHRIEALPGDGRYAVTFRRADGSEQTAIVQLSEEGLDVAEASLPVGWSRTSDQFRATAATVNTFEQARRTASIGPTLRDVPGGWDVSLGNVVIGDAGLPVCTAHGDLAPAGDAAGYAAGASAGDAPRGAPEGAYACPECGARALLG